MKLNLENKRADFGLDEGIGFAIARQFAARKGCVLF